MGRASIQGIDALVVVAEPGGRSIETAKTIARMGSELGIKHVAAIANKITDMFQVETIKSRLTIPILANINYNPAVQEADFRNKAVFGASDKLVNQLREAKDRLISLIGNK
jgi:CO dehydrogenase maturation factor